MKHVGIVKKWLNGAVVQYEKGKDCWVDLPSAKDMDQMPVFNDESKYRIKPKKVYRVLYMSTNKNVCVSTAYYEDEQEFKKWASDSVQFLQILESTAKVK